MESEPTKITPISYIVTFLTLLLSGGLAYTNSHDINYTNGILEITESKPIQKIEESLPPLAKFKILESKKYYLRVEREDGKIELRTGGNITWRTNNPAKIKFGRFAQENNGYKPGNDQEVAIFPTEEFGNRANYNLLFKTKLYSEKTLEQAIEIYSPASDGYRPASYTDDLVKAGFDKTKTLKNFTEEERTKLLNTIKKREGWTEGKVTIFETYDDYAKRGW